MIAYEPNEPFRSGSEKIDLSILDFWKWYGSNLLYPIVRGYLAEFIILKALQINEELKLKPFGGIDLIYKSAEKGEIKIEVKSAALVIDWGKGKQGLKGTISFSVPPKSRMESDRYNTKHKIRKADIYVFSVLNNEDFDEVNPLNLDQWEFYLVPAKSLNELLGESPTLSMSKLKKNFSGPVQFSNVKNKLDTLLLTT